MRIGKIIESFVNGKYKALGFCYKKKTSDPWVYTKTNGEKEYTLLFSRYTWDKHLITFEMGATEADVLNKSAHEICQGCGNSYMPGYWTFKAEEELEKDLEEMLTIVTEHCEEVISFFDRAYDFRLTYEMNKKLLKRHDELSGLHIGELSADEVKKCYMDIFDDIKRLEDTGRKEEDILRIASCIGTIYQENMGGLWEMVQFGRFSHCCITVDGVFKIAPLIIVRNAYIGIISRENFGKIFQD